MVTEKDEIISHSLRMMQIDFEQRSQQVIQLALDRSKFLKIALVVWGAPLIIAATILGGKLHPDSLRLSPNEILALSFFAAALVNSIILSAMVGNRNSSNLAASGMNYLRGCYFKVLPKNGYLTLPEDLAKTFYINLSDSPSIRLVRSKSTDLWLLVTAFTNVVYAAVGVFLVYGTNLLLGMAAFLIVCVVHVAVLHSNDLWGSVLR